MRLADTENNLRHNLQAFIDPTSYAMSELLKDQAHFLDSHQPGSNSSSQPTTQAQQAKVDELEAEVARLKSQLSKAKSVNDAMWEAVVQRVIVPKDERPAMRGTNGIR